MQNVLGVAAFETSVKRVGQAETGASRDEFFESGFDEHLPFKTQPDQWYRDDFP